MTHAYIDLTTFKASGLMNIVGTGDDTRLRDLIKDASRQVDLWCNRRFQALSATRAFNGPGALALPVPDLISVASLKEDQDNDGVYEATWAATDYLLAPYNADPATAGNEEGRPYTAIEVNRRSNGTKASFLTGQRRFEVAGLWGYWQHLRRATETGTVATTTGTTLTLSAATDVKAGHTVLVESEQMYVTALSGNDATVVRGANGTTGAAHSAKPIDIHEYPGPIVEAVAMQAGRLWKRAQTGFARAPGTERAGLDPDVRDLLAAFRRSPLGTG